MIRKLSLFLSSKIIDNYLVDIFLMICFHWRCTWNVLPIVHWHLQIPCIRYLASQLYITIKGCSDYFNLIQRASSEEERDLSPAANEHRSRPLTLF